MQSGISVKLMWLGGLALGLTCLGCVTLTDGTFAEDAELYNSAKIISHETGPIIAGGADVGSPPQVKVYNARTGTLVADIRAFPSTFRGGVRVAVGDVNGDGTPDIIVGAGPGGGPQVQVFDGRTFEPLAGPLGSFVGLTSKDFKGGVFVAAGDVNGDGCADVIVSADAGGGPQVVVWDGKTGKMLKSFNALPETFKGGVRVAVGDVNGDGRADIIAAAGPGGGPQVTVYDFPSLKTLLSFHAFPSDFRGGVFVAAGDVNGDGKADVIAGAGAGGLPQVAIFNGANGTLLHSFFASNPAVNDFLSQDAREHSYVASAGSLNDVRIKDADDHAGVRVGTVTTNGKVEILTAPGPELPPVVDIYSIQPVSPQRRFYAFKPSYRYGVFLGGS